MGDINFDRETFKIPELSLVVSRQSPFSTRGLHASGIAYKDVSLVIDTVRGRDCGGREFLSEDQEDMLEHFARRLFEPLLPDDRRECYILRRFIRPEGVGSTADCTCASSGYRGSCRRAEEYATLRESVEKERAAFEVSNPGQYRINLRLGSEKHPECWTRRPRLINETLDLLERNHTGALSESEVVSSQGLLREAWKYAEKCASVSQAADAAPSDRQSRNLFANLWQSQTSDKSRSPSPARSPSPLNFGSLQPAKRFPPPFTESEKPQSPTPRSRSRSPIGRLFSPGSKYTSHDSS